MVDQNFKSFFALLKKKKQGKFKNKVNIPKYLNKDGYFKICDPEGNKRINIINDELYWTIPMSRLFLKGGITLFDGSVAQSHDRVKVKLPDILKNKKIKQIWIIPKNKGFYFEIQVIYEIKINNDQIDQLSKNKYLSIDLGVNNLCTCTYYNPYSINLKNKFKSFIIDGKKLKSINQFYNKQISKLQQLAAKDNKASYYTKRMYNITRKRNNRINDYINKTSKYIIDYCLKYGIYTIVLGYNQQWKNKSKLDKKNNQNFISIPFYKLKENLKYRSELKNIELVIQEESYTSKANFINNDYIPTYEKVELKKNVYDENKKYKFTGYRPSLTRGQYIFNNTSYKLKLKYINSDLNGSLNILRKYLNNTSKVVNIVKSFDIVKDFNDILYHRGALIAPIRIKLK